LTVLLGRHTCNHLAKARLVEELQLSFKEGSMKSFIEREAKFLLMWLLGFPLFVIAVGFVAV
jgi:hypothetical protein